MMKKLLATFATLAAFAGAVQAESISVAATAVPHAEILEFVKPALAKQGVELQIKVFTDYVQPNVQVAEGRLDANFFQHQPYLDEFNSSRGTQLVSIAGVHVEPFGAYSSKVKNLADLPQGANVVIPNDATNGGRALLLLQSHGLIKLKEGAGLKSTPLDVVSNPKKLKFIELDAAQLPRSLDDLEASTVNTNFAISAGLNPKKDAIALESAKNPYVNIMVVREADKNQPWVAQLIKSYHSEEVRQFIEKEFKGSVFPAF